MKHLPPSLAMRAGHREWPVLIAALMLVLPGAATAPAFAQSEGAIECVASTSAPTFEGNGPSGLHAVPHDEQAAPHTAFHGQLLLGRNALYLYHLPLFMDDAAAHPHNFQVVLEATLPAEDAATLSEDQEVHSIHLYSSEPEAFDQSALVLDYPGHARLRSLRASVVRGHFERQPNETIIDGTTLDIGEVVHFREFAAGGEQLDQLTYLLFGRGGESFMVHLLSAPPDFDQVLSVTLGESGASGEEVRRGLYLSFPGRSNSASKRLEPGDALTCRFDRGGEGEAGEIAITVTEDLYCEAGEVAQVGFGDSRPCP